MEKPYRTVLFDMDGTLLDSFDANAGTALITMEEFGLPVPEGDSIRKFIGRPFEYSFSHWYHLEGEALNRVVTRFRALYEERKFLCTVYPGVFALLEELRLRGVYTAIATLKREPHAQILAEQFGLAQRLDVVQGRELDRGVLSKADIIRSALERLGEDATHAIMVGDSDYDQVGAQAAGVDFVALYYGFGFSHAPGDGADSAHCVGELESVEELADFLLRRV